MATGKNIAIQNASNTELDNKKQKKRWLSKAFNFVAPAIAGMGVGLALKSCAVTMLCTAGAPAIVTAIVASASAGLITSALRETWKHHRTEKKQDANAKFWTKKRLTSLFIGATIGGAFGSLGFAFADEIKDAASGAYGKITELSLFASDTETIAPLPLVIQNFGTTFISPPSVADITEINEANSLIDTQKTITEEMPATILPEPVIIQPDIHTVEKNDNLWNIVKEHYSLTSNADIQRYTDGVAASNNLTSGTTANNISLGDKIMLLPADILENHNKLVLDWIALDEETKSRLLSQNTVINKAFQPTPH